MDVKKQSRYLKMLFFLYFVGLGIGVALCRYLL